jgi:hypothetical protein
MEKKIRSELLKMTFMMLVLAGLGIYAHEFVIAGIKAKVALNLTIFATFGVAAWLAFSHVLNLKNEVTALKALQIDYGSRSRRPLDPYKTPAVVFQEPELLGQGYRMITEELGKQDSLQISNATAQTILHDVDQRISDRKSTIIYFSGLMVFLGLLGAFMGLMKTVHSVGDLIGSMDVSGGGGTDSFGKLIEGMKGPLNGMSVGFSSSLFGLMTSMVLGALERCMTSAMKTLRNEFEHWLSNVSALEAPQHEAAAGGVDLSNVVRALDMGMKSLRDMREGITAHARASEASQLAMATMAQAVESLGRSVESATDPARVIQPIADCVAELARNQTVMVGQLQGLIRMAQDDRAAVRDMLAEMRGLTDQHGTLDGPQMHAQLERLILIQTELAEREANGGVAPLKPVGLLGWISALLAAGPARERRRLRSEVRRAIVTQRRMICALERKLGSSVGKLDAARLRDEQRVERMFADSRRNNARLASLLDRIEENAGPAATDAITGGLHGARAEMETLRRRLEILRDDSEPAPSAAPDEAATPERRSGGSAA